HCGEQAIEKGIVIGAAFGGKHCIAAVRTVGGSRRRVNAGEENHGKDREQRASKVFHGFTSAFGCTFCLSCEFSNPGGGRIGGRSCSCARFCTSISEKSMAGATAETG